MEFGGRLTQHFISKACVLSVQQPYYRAWETGLDWYWMNFLLDLEKIKGAWLPQATVFTVTWEKVAAEEFCSKLMFPETKSNQCWWSTRLMWLQGNMKRRGRGKPAALMEHISSNISLLQPPSPSAFFCPFPQYPLRIPSPAKALSMKTPSFAGSLATEGCPKRYLWLFDFHAIP